MTRGKNNMYLMPTWFMDDDGINRVRLESEEVIQIKYLRERARIKLMNKIKKIAACKGITNKQRTWRKNQANACDKLRNQIKRHTVSLQLLGVKHE